MLLKTCMAFADPIRIPTLNSKLRIMAHNKTDHLRHLSGCAMDKEFDASIQFFNAMGGFFGAVTMGGGVWRHSRSCDSHCTCSSWRGIPCSIHLWESCKHLSPPLHLFILTEAYSHKWIAKQMAQFHFRTHVRMTILLQKCELLSIYWKLTKSFHRFQGSLAWLFLQVL